jgi:hypothetical protein
MADAITLIKAPVEKMQDFNIRLKQSCESQPVTDVSIVVIDGEPAVTLFSEVVEATQEDVDEAKEDGQEIKLGEMIPEQAPMMAQVTRVSAVDAQAAAKSQDRMERLYERAGGSVIKQLHAEGSRAGFMVIPDSKPEQKAWVTAPEHYMLVAYLPADEESGEKEKPDA